MTLSDTNHLVDIGPHVVYDTHLKRFVYNDGANWVEMPEDMLRAYGRLAFHCTQMHLHNSRDASDELKRVLGRPY